MRRIATQPFAIRAWIIALLIGLAFAGLEYGLSLGAQQAASPETRSWLDLGLFLCAYLFAFCLQRVEAGHVQFKSTGCQSVGHAGGVFTKLC